MRVGFDRKLACNGLKVWASTRPSWTRARSLPPALSERLRMAKTKVVPRARWREVMCGFLMSGSSSDPIGVCAAGPEAHTVPT